MRCPHCKCKIVTEKVLPKKTMTRAQFEKLKKGSIVRSHGNRKRVVVERIGAYIRLRKLSYGSGYPHDYTGYLYSDISRGYTVVKY